MTNEINRFSTTVVSHYDLYRAAYPHWDDFQKAVGEPIRRLYAKMPAKARVLEIGCGTGETTRYLRAPDSRSPLVAIDIDPNMIEQISTKFEEEVSSGSLLPTVAEARGYLSKQEECSLDAVATAWTLHNISRDNREQILRQVQRVLRPGGLFVIGDKFYVDNLSESQKLLRKFLDDFLAALEENGRLELARDWIIHEIDDLSVDRVMVENHFVFHLENVGFERIERTFRARVDSVFVAVKS